MFRSRWLQVLGSLVISVVFGWLALRDLELDEVADALRDADYAWIVPAVAAMLASAWMKAERWRCIFPQPRPPLRATWWSLQIGYLLNSVLPLRAGELGRALALSHETGIARTHAITTVVVERVFDLCALALLLLVALVLLPEGDLTHELTLVSISTLIVAAALAAAAAHPGLRARGARLVLRLPVVGGVRGRTTVRSLGLGLSALRNPRMAVVASAWSVGSWILLGVSNWFVLQAFPIDVEWHAALFVLVVSNLALVIPASAGAIGLYEAAVRAALAGYAVPGALALGYGIALHAVNLVPYLVLGAIGLARLGLRTRDLLASDPPPG